MPEDPLTIDGVKMEFQNTPGIEASVEKNAYFPLRAGRRGDSSTTHFLAVYGEIYGIEFQRAGDKQPLPQNSSIRPADTSAHGMISMPAERCLRSRAVVITHPRLRPRSFMHCRSPATA